MTRPGKLPPTEWVNGKRGSNVMRRGNSARVGARSKRENLHTYVSTIFKSPELFNIHALWVSLEENRAVSIRKG